MSLSLSSIILENDIDINTLIERIVFLEAENKKLKECLLEPKTIIQISPPVNVHKQTSDRRFRDNNTCGDCGRIIMSGMSCICQNHY